MKNTKNSGFSLLELMIVVSIIAILVSIFGPMFSGRPGNSPQSTEMVSVSSAPKSIWPPVPKDDELIQPADNLLAKNYFVIFDDSGSMNSSECSAGKTKMEAAKEALVMFAKSVPTDANLGLMTFDENWLKVPLGVNNRSSFVNLVMSEIADNNTPLDGALKEAYAIISEQGQKQSGYGEYNIVVVTDGEATIGSIVDIITSTPIIIQTIGFCIGEGHPLNQPDRMVYRVAENPQELQEGLTSVLAESPTFSVSDFQAH